MKNSQEIIIKQQHTQAKMILVEKKIGRQETEIQKMKQELNDRK